MKTFFNIIKNAVIGSIVFMGIIIVIAMNIEVDVPSEADMYAAAQSIPAAEWQANVDAYTELNEIFPSDKYQGKIDLYQGKIDAKISEAAEAKAAAIQTIKDNIDSSEMVRDCKNETISEAKRIARRANVSIGRRDIMYRVAPTQSITLGDGDVSHVTIQVEPYVIFSASQGFRMKSTCDYYVNTVDGSPFLGQKYKNVENLTDFFAREAKSYEIDAALAANGR